MRLVLQWVRSGPLRRRSLGAVAVSAYVVLFVAELPYQALFPVLPSLARELSMSDLQTGALVSATPIGALAAALPLGVLAQRIGLRSMVLASAAGLAVTSLAHTLAPDFWTLLLARGAFGVVHTGVWIAAPALAGVVAAGTNTPAVAAAIMPIGAIGAIVSPLGAGIAAEHFGARSPFLFAAAIAALAFAFCLRFLPEAAGAPITAKPLGVLHALADAPVRAAVVLTAIAALVGNAVSLLISFQLDDNGVSPSGIGVVFGVSFVFFLFGSIASTFSGARGATVTVGVAATCLLAASMAPMVLSASVTLLVAFALAKSVFLAFIYTVSYPLAMTGGEARSAAALAILSLAWGAGALTGPLLAAATAERIGTGSTYALLITLTVSAAAWVVVDMRRRASDVRAVVEVT